MGFRDRQDAGRKLAAALAHLAPERPVVVALPRGGVPVAREVADALGAPLDVLVVRKLSLPAQPDLGMGAVAEAGSVFLDPRTLALADLSESEVGREVRRAEADVERRAALYRNGRSRVPLGGRTVILVDDGISTGGTIRAALGALSRAGAQKVVLAAPVITAAATALLRPLVAELVCLQERRALRLVGRAYVDARQIRDEEVVAILGDPARPPAQGAQA